MRSDHPSLARTLFIRLLIAGLLGLAALALLVRQGLIAIPDGQNPFVPLNVRDEPTWLTGYKLSRIERMHLSVWRCSLPPPVGFTPLPNQVTGEGCGFTIVVDVDRSSVTFNKRFPATCPLAVSWAMFELHVLQPAARQHLGQEVARVQHFDTYACRNLYHREAGRRSEHATANAIDIAGFRLADGTQITVLADWNGSASRAAFLRALRDGACRFFDVVLSPDYNEAHRDHFHFDMGDREACR